MAALELTVPINVIGSANTPRMDISPFRARVPQAGGAMTNADYWTRALTQETRFWPFLGAEFTEGVLSMPGIGTAIRTLDLPARAPTAVETGTAAEEFVTGFQRREPVRTEEDLARVRTEMGAIDEETYKASPNYRPDIPWDEGMTTARAEALAAWYDEGTYRRSLIERGPQGFFKGYGAAFVARLAGGALDPVNYIPIFGPLARAAAIGRYGAVGGRALIGAGEAAANVGITEIAVQDIRRQLGDPTGFGVIVETIATGALIGAAFGGIVGAVVGRRQSRAVARLTAESDANRALLNSAVGDIVQGRPVDIPIAVIERVRQSAEAGRVVQTVIRDTGRGEPPVPDGMIRLYRGETDTGEIAQVPEWVRQNPEYQATLDATGRWFSRTRDEAQYYVDTFGNRDDRISYIDIPEGDLERFRVANQPDVARFSAAGRAVDEFFVPKELAAARKQIPSIRDFADIPLTERVAALRAELDRLAPELPEELRQRAAVIAATDGVELDRALEQAVTENIRRKPSGAVARDEIAELPERPTVRELVEEFDVDPKTGKMGEVEEVELEQLRAAGRIDEADEAALKEADELLERTNTWGKALREAAACRLIG